MKLPKGRRAIIGGGVAVFAGSAVAIGVSLRQAYDTGAADGAKTAASVETGEAGAVCLKTAFPLIEGAGKKCYQPAELSALEDQPVLDADGASASVALSSPTDQSSPTKDASTCREYNQLADEGWYALSSRDMRREEFFKRACGTLAFLQQAKTPEVTYFKNGDLSEDDARSLAATAKFHIGPAAAAPAPAPVIAPTDNGGWRITTGDQIAFLQPIAHADFDDDGRGDMLVFVAMRVEGGTATAREIGLLEKSGEEGPVTFEARE